MGLKEIQVRIEDVRKGKATSEMSPFFLEAIFAMQIEIYGQLKIIGDSLERNSSSNTKPITGKTR